MNDHLFVKELVILFTVRRLLAFPFDFEGWMWELVVLIHDHYFSIDFLYFTWFYRYVIRNKDSFIANDICRKLVVHFLLF